MKKILISISIVGTMFSSDFNSDDGAPIRQGVHVEWYRTVSPGNPGETIFILSLIHI